MKIVRKAFDRFAKVEREASSWSVPIKQITVLTVDDEEMVFDVFGHGDEKITTDAYIRKTLNRNNPPVRKDLREWDQYEIVMTTPRREPTPETE